MKKKRITYSMVCLLVFLQVFSLAPGQELHAKTDEKTQKTETTKQIPTVSISTNAHIGNSLGKGNGYVDATISITDCEQPIPDAPGQVKVRGNSTSNAPKKPYTIKFSNKQNLFGMGKAKKWVLLANCFDPTLLRNAMALQVASKLNLDYVSDFQFVDVYMDGVFKGNYLLTEQIETGKNRIDIDWDQGEFLLQLETARTEAGTSYLLLNQLKCRFALCDPETPTTEEYAYIQEKMNEVETALLSKDMKKICNVVDVDSFIDFYIFNEWMKTVDVEFSSVYFYYKDGKLYAGPPWDYDLSSGNAGSAYDVFQLDSSEGFWAQQRMFYYLCDIEECYQMVQARYAQLLPQLQNIYEQNGWIDQTIRDIQPSITRNFSEAGWKINTAYTDGMKQPCDTYEENVTYLKNWLSKRTTWLAEQWNASVAKLDYAAYYRAVSLAMQYAKEDYDNYTPLDNALAQPVYGETVTQLDINAATASILSAISKLQKKQQTTLVSYEFEPGIAGETIPSGTAEETEYAQPLKIVTSSVITEKPVKNNTDGTIATNRAVKFPTDSSISAGKSVKTTTGTTIVTQAVLVGAVKDAYLSFQVNADTKGKLKWSKAQYTDGNKKDTSVPILSASEETPWGASGEVYAKLTVPTKYFTRLQFSASIGATKKGAKSYQLQYSTDGTHWNSMIGSTRSLNDNKKMQTLYDNYQLPDSCSDQDELYLRLTVASDETLETDTGFFGSTGGEIAFNHITITGIQQNVSYCKYKKAVQKAASYNETYYWNYEPLKKALEQDVYTETITQEEIDLVTSEIEAAIAQLVPKKLYTVSFETNGGEPLEPITVIEGETMSVQPIAIREGYKWTGWYTDPDLTQLWDDTAITDSICLYAAWEPVICQVTFQDYDETVLKEQSVNYGESAVAPEPPVREGYVFQGWSCEFETVTTNLVVVALYAPIEPVTDSPAPDDTNLPDTTEPNTTDSPDTHTPAPDTDSTCAPTATIALTMPPVSNLSSPSPVPSPSVDVPSTEDHKQTEKPVGTPAAPVVDQTEKPARSLVIYATYQKPVANQKPKTVSEKKLTTLTLYTKGISSAKLTTKDKNPVVWKSSNKKVASVKKDGTVIVHRKGTAKITAICNGQQTTVTVRVKQASFLKMPAKQLVMTVGQTKRFVITAKPAGKLTVRSNRPSILKVKKNTLWNARSKGCAKVSVTCNGMKKTVNVTVR